MISTPLRMSSVIKRKLKKWVKRTQSGNPSCSVASIKQNSRCLILLSYALEKRLRSVNCRLQPLAEGRRTSSGGSTWQSVRQYICLLDLRRLCQEIGRFFHQRLGNFSRQVRVASCFVGKRVEDREGSRAKFNPKPSGCCGFLLHQTLSIAQKFRDFVFFARFCLQSDK